MLLAFGRMVPIPFGLGGSTILKAPFRLLSSTSESTPQRKNGKLIDPLKNPNGSA